MPKSKSEKKPVFIYSDGEFWKVVHKTVNGFMCESEAGERKLFPSWKVKHGKEEFKIKWPEEKAKRQVNKKVS